MTKRGRTPGERITHEIFYGRLITSGSVATAIMIDRVIRREKAKAWDECCDKSAEMTDVEDLIDANPYWKAKR